MPTVVFEYRYSETSHTLALDAACHLLLSCGLVQLVVVVDVKRKSGAQDASMVLEQVMWAHWDSGSRRELLQGGRFFMARKF